ncbi:MAG: NAD-dependent epimerase/dehydratase family protein [Mariprofundaceae bacterium]
MKVLVNGASSMIGHFLLPRLVQSGCEVIATSRQNRDAVDGVRWMKADLLIENSLLSLDKVDVWIHLGPIALLSDAIAMHGVRLGVQRVISFSSTSRFTKEKSKGRHDRDVARSLVEGEEKLEEICRKHSISWTVFRPTLIYCLGRDKNLTLIRNFISKFSFFPLPAGGKGLRQPVHAEDLAHACVQVLSNEASLNKAYVLSGGEVLSYRDMVTGVFLNMGKKPCFLGVPLSFLRTGIYVARILPKYRYLTADMADRMAMDMIFSHDEAAKDFGYTPRSFQP